MILYSTNCSKCRVLKCELQKAGISFRESTNFEVLILKGIFTVPVIDLENGTPLMMFNEAMLYVKGLANNGKETN